MQTQIETTGCSRVNKMKLAEKLGRSAARAFLARVEADDALAAKMAEADGDMARVVAIAAEAGYACTPRELHAAYEDLVRSGPDAALRAPSDLGHAAVYLSLRAPSDLGHAAVYLSLRAPSDLGHAAVYLGLRSS